MLSEHKATDIKILGSYSIMPPMSVIFEVTNKCPLNCLHCFNSSSPNKSDELNTSEVLTVLDKLYQAGVQRITITGGEPTGRKDFKRIIEYCATHFVSVAIPSNGFFITDDFALWLSQYKNNVAVQISIDGDKETHNKIRGNNNSYDKAMAAIKYLSTNGVLVVHQY